MTKVPIRWVYDRLYCQFHHYDLCLSGLVTDEGVQKFVQVVDEHVDDIMYTIHEFDWTHECLEYMEDYRRAFGHWFYNPDGTRPAWDGSDCQWFRDKWKGRNPIEEQAK